MCQRRSLRDSTSASSRSASDSVTRSSPTGSTSRLRSSGRSARSRRPYPRLPTFAGSVSGGLRGAQGRARVRWRHRAPHCRALSATHQSAVLGADAVAGAIDVRVVDTKAVSMAQGLVAMTSPSKPRAAPRSTSSSSAPNHEGEGWRDRDARHPRAAREGRTRWRGAGPARPGSLDKPLLELKDGEVVEAGGQRTTAKALAAIVETTRSPFRSPAPAGAIVHGDSSDVKTLENYFRL